MQMEVIPSGNNVFLNFTNSTFIVFLIELSTFFFFLFLWRVGVVVRLRRRGMRTLWTRVYHLFMPVPCTVADGCWRISAGDEQGSVAGILLLPYFEEFDFLLAAEPCSPPADIRQHPIGDYTSFASWPRNKQPITRRQSHPVYRSKTMKNNEDFFSVACSLWALWHSAD